MSPRPCCFGSVVHHLQLRDGPIHSSCLARVVAGLVSSPTFPWLAHPIQAGYSKDQGQFPCSQALRSGSSILTQAVPALLLCSGKAQGPLSKDLQGHGWRCSPFCFHVIVCLPSSLTIGFVLVGCLSDGYTCGKGCGHLS